MNLILLDGGADGGTSATLTLPDPRAAHMLNVLRVVPGQTVRVGQIDGPIGIATVVDATTESVTLSCAFEDVPPRPRVDLLLALPRPKVMRRLWAQLAALGVGRIILTNAERVERHYFDTHVLSPETYRPLLIEGLQQARDTHLPRVTIHRQFRVLVEDELDAMAGDAVRVVADPHAHTPIREAISSDRATRVLLAVGPEGGWNGFELSLLAAHGFQAVGMGPRTLRTDTACVALLGIVNSES
jgi:RsmE family RNA methyltransferase